MKYYYLPGSAAAHDRAVAESTGGAGAGPPPAYAILRPAQPYDLATPGTPAGILTLAAAAAGRWRTEARFALAASVEDGAVVASLALRLTDDSPGRQRRAWAVYVRTEDPETGESSWKPAGAGLLDPGDPTRPLRPIGVNELKAVLRGEVYVPPPPRAGPPRLACQECDRATPYSTKTWRPYTRHRCAPRTEGRS